MKHEVAAAAAAVAAASPPPPMNLPTSESYLLPPPPPPPPMVDTHAVVPSSSSQPLPGINSVSDKHNHDPQHHQQHHHHQQVSPDHVMSSLGFSAYNAVAASSPSASSGGNNSRKYQEGTVAPAQSEVLPHHQPQHSVNSSTAYPYFVPATSSSSSNHDLSSPLYGSYSTTGVFSAKSFSSSSPSSSSNPAGNKQRAKSSRANAGKAVQSGISLTHTFGDGAHTHSKFGYEARFCSHSLSSR